MKTTETKLFFVSLKRDDENTKSLIVEALNSDQAKFLAVEGLGYINSRFSSRVKEK